MKTLGKRMKTKMFKTEEEARKFAELQRQSRYIIDGIYPPTRTGGSGMSGMWIVWYH
jgi:hypothetical protein